MTSNVIVTTTAAPMAEPVPPGTVGARVSETTGAHTPEAARPGLEGEETVWEGHYSAKNFLGRLLLGGLLTLLWLWLAVYAWGLDHSGWGFWALVSGIALVAFWGYLAYKYLRAYRGHHYRLTTRRLFVTTGFFRRRVDQIELIRIKDVYLQQSMLGDWLGIGNVVVISSEESLPRALLLGVDAPRRVMDLIWHHMRLEQGQKTERINPV